MWQKVWGKQSYSDQKWKNTYTKERTQENLSSYKKQRNFWVDFLQKKN